MGKKPKKSNISSTHFKVFGFMINPYSLLIISQDGQKLAQMEVESESAAKEKFTSASLNQQLITTLGRPDFSTIWSDDPAGDPEVMEACRKMEQGQADQLLADVMTDEEVADVLLLPQDAADFLMRKGRFVPDDRVLQDEAHPEEIETPIEEGAAIETPVEEPTGELPKEEPPIPKFKPTPKTRIIEVECPETYTEGEIKRLARNLQSLKGEALASAANYREQIKVLEKALFEACNGKSYTPMECSIETDWEAGVRRYIRPDTGEAAKTEQIPYEERQLNMNQALADATSNPPEQLADNVDNPGTEQPPAAGAVVDESALTPEIVAEEQEPFDEPDDFPPPDEAEELLDEESIEEAANT